MDAFAGTGDRFSLSPDGEDRMTAHEIQLNNPGRTGLANYRLYVLPRSADPFDYALVSPVTEKELLSRGLDGPLEIHGYQPILEKVGSKVKEYLHTRIMKARDSNFRSRRVLRWGSAAGIVSCLTFVFSGFIDDLLLDPVFLSTIVFTFYSEFQEKRKLNQVRQKIENISFVCNPLLSALFESFSRLPDGDLPPVDWSEIISGMPAEEVQTLFGVIADFTGFRRRKDWETKKRHAERDATSPGLTGYIARIWSRYYQGKLDDHREMLKHRRRLSSGYAEMYEYLLEASPESIVGLPMSRNIEETP
jgi:hypothetical protein